MIFVFIYIYITRNEEIGNYFPLSNEKEINQSFMRGRYFHINHFIMNINIFKCL